MSSTKSKSKSPKSPSKRKTKKLRQTIMTDYYNPRKGVPTFEEIYQNRHVFPQIKQQWKTPGDNWKFFVESLAKFKDDQEPDKIQLFYADAPGSEYLEDQYDDENMLDIHKKLTKKYLNKLYKNHTKWMKTRKYDYDIYYQNSYDRFEKLKRLPSAFIQHMDGKIHGKHYIAKHKLPSVLADYADSYIVKNSSYETKMAAK